VKTDELMETKSRRDSIRELLVDALRRAENLPPEIAQLLDVDAQITGELRARLNAVVTAAREKS
jgi:hypothetical protein